jgi:coenzyme F420-0:L-glutamate ligase / coenzyme F420-1:gamma-L-glutamate ligase
MDQEFWRFLDQLVSASQVEIDRPKGSAHPRLPDLIYPLDYGYLQGTTTVDGGGIDLFLGSQAGSLLDALLLTVDLYKRDAEIKLLLGCNEAEKQVALEFSNDASMRACLVRRGSDLQALRDRRSVRRFQPRPVPEEIVHRLLETATWAPSAHNAQPWRFAVLTSLTARSRLSQALGQVFRHDLLAGGLPIEDVEAQVSRSCQRIQDAPLAVLLCQDLTVGELYPDSDRQRSEHIMGMQSVALAGGHLLLAAWAEGLGGVWMCAPLFAPAAARQALDLPESWQPQALILLGYPAKIPPRRQRHPIEDVTIFF